MKILILGAGKVGATLASHLSGEAEDITIVDLDEEKLREGALPGPRSPAR